LPGYKRILRGLRAILGIAHPDDAWAAKRLPPEEYALYAALDPRDREHAVLVAKGLLSRFPDAPPEAVRAALLHDAGKSVRPYRAIERILTALLEPWLPRLPPEPLLPGWQGAVQVRLYHERYAAQRIRDPGVRALVLEMTKEAYDQHASPRWAQRIAAIDDLF